MGNYTGLLYARPSFFEGVSRIVDFGGTLNEYNTSSSGDEADREALEADWRAISQDLRQAIESYRASQAKPTHGTK